MTIAPSPDVQMAYASNTDCLGLEDPKDHPWISHGHALCSASYWAVPCSCLGRDTPELQPGAHVLPPPLSKPPLPIHCESRTLTRQLDGQDFRVYVGQCPACKRIHYFVGDPIP